MWKALILIQVGLVHGHSNGGFAIQHLAKDSVFARIGLKEGDIVQSFNGRPIGDESAARELEAELKTAKKVDLVILRDGKEQRLHFRTK